MTDIMRIIWATCHYCGEHANCYESPRAFAPLCLPCFLNWRDMTETTR